jgi:hypothetical protein
LPFKKKSKKKKRRQRARRKERRKARQGSNEQVPFLATAWQNSHAKVEKKGGSSVRGDLKSIEILAKILASPFLFWLVFIGFIRVILDEAHGV